MAKGKLQVMPGLIVGSLFAGVVGLVAGAVLMLLIPKLLIMAGLVSAPADEGPGMNGGGPGGPPPAMVRLGEADERQVQNRVELIGRLQEVRHATVAAEVAGRVLAVPVEEGDTVVGGETVLAEVDGVWARLDLAAAEADVMAAQATLDQSRRDLAYLEDLLAAQSAKPREVDDIRATVKANEARLDAAKARRDRATEELQRLKIVAPFDGVVTRKLTEVGQWMQPGSSVAQIISHQEIDALIHVPERYINHLHVDAEVSMLVEALDEVFTGNVISINPQGGNVARTFPVKIRLDDQSGVLKAGMSVKASLPIGDEANRMTVPRDAVLSTPQGDVVWVAVLDDHGEWSAQGVQVQPLFMIRDRVVVAAQGSQDASPLQAGSRVVIEGGEGLIPQQILTLVEEADAQAADDAMPPLRFTAE